MRYKWFVKNLDKNKMDEILKSHSLNPMIARILVNRGVQNIDQFLNPTAKNSLHDPYLMKDMDRAVDIIIAAIEDEKHIRIIGDYDQDGNSSVMTLIDGLKYFTDHISYDIPERTNDGYGISKRLIDIAIKDKVDLIITCDNGISALDQVEYARENGLSIIITDHHQVIMEDGKQVLPNANAIVDPKRLDCEYPFKELCGAGVAFKLIQALFMELGGDEDYLLDLLEYVCMGTICDIVDLIDENRFMVKEGLKKLNQTENLGILKLKEETGLKTEFSVYNIGFIIGPCINASGRLDTAKRGVQLLFEENIDDVSRYAKELVQLNQLRKEMTEKGIQKSIDIIETNQYQKDDIIIVVNDEIHESIAGIIAGRIKEKYYRPTLVLTKSSNKNILKGSGRSIEEYNIHLEFSKVKDLFISFGGHPMACGLSLDHENVDALRKRINKLSKLSKDDKTPKLYLDSTLYISQITFDLIDELKKLEPFGKANPKPLFGDKDIRIKQCSVIGKNKNVLKFQLEKDGKVIQAIMYQNVEETIHYLMNKFGKENLKKSFMNIQNDNKIDICYYPEINEFNHKKYIQLIIKDLR